MSYLLPTTFSKYHLDESEQIQSQSLTALNIQGLQNLICTAAEEKIGLILDPLNPTAYAQREAELQGQIGILKFVIELSQQVSPSLVINS